MPGPQQMQMRRVIERLKHRQISEDSLRIGRHIRLAKRGFERRRLAGIEGQ